MAPFSVSSASSTLSCCDSVTPGRCRKRWPGTKSSKAMPKRSAYRPGPACRQKENNCAPCSPLRHLGRRGTGEVGETAQPRGVPHLTPTLFASEDGEGDYCIVDFGVGTMRWMRIFSRSRHSGTRGAILVFQKSVSYTALYCASRSDSLLKRRSQM